jgi:glutaredoxin-related protein
MTNSNLFKIVVAVVLGISLLNSCAALKPAPSDARKVSPNVEERVRANIEEGRGFRLFGGEKRGGTFDFASSNELWRASLDIIDFMPLMSANYSGGIIITDWYSDGKAAGDSVKVSIRFLTNEIRSDALDIKVFMKKCKDLNNCIVSETKGVLILELNKKILKQASIYKTENTKKNYKKYENTNMRPKKK